MSDTHDPSEPIPGADAPVPGEQARPANPDAIVSVAGNQFAWPVPDRSVDVAGRRLPLEVAVVAGVHAFAAVWLLLALHDLWPIVPDLIGGLFSDLFSFAISWAILIVVALLVYLIGLLAFCAYKLVRQDPVGRGLASVVCALLTMLQFTDARTTSITLIWLVSCACVAVLFLSPWVRRSLDGHVSSERPASVVLSQTLAVTFLALLGVVVVALLPGIRFIGDLGAGFVFFELVGITSVVVGRMGVRRLSAGPDTQARLMLTLALVAPVIAMLSSGTGAGVATSLGVLGGVVIPLWALPDARRWFGEAPLSARQ